MHSIEALREGIEQRRKEERDEEQHKRQDKQIRCYQAQQPLPPRTSGATRFCDVAHGYRFGRNGRHMGLHLGMKERAASQPCVRSERRRARYSHIQPDTPILRDHLLPGQWERKEMQGSASERERWRYAICRGGIAISPRPSQARPEEEPIWLRMGDSAERWLALYVDTAGLEIVHHLRLQLIERSIERGLVRYRAIKIIPHVVVDRRKVRRPLPGADLRLGEDLIHILATVERIGGRAVLLLRRRVRREPADLVDADVEAARIRQIPLDELFGLLRIFSIGDDRDGRTTPHRRRIGACGPLWQRSYFPLAGGIFGVTLDKALPPDRRRPTGDGALVERGVPVIREVGNRRNQPLIDQVLPVVSHLLGGGAIDVDLPGLIRRVFSEPLRACLPHQPSDPAGALRRERDNVIVRAEMVNLDGVLCELIPGGRRRSDARLLEDL